VFIQLTAFIYMSAPQVRELCNRWMVLFGAYALAYRFILTNHGLLYVPVSVFSYCRTCTL